MEQKQSKHSLYNRGVKFLRKPFFQVIANVFSHGATHLLFFFIVGIITAYLWFFNNQENIDPHNIGIKIGWLSYEKYKGAVDSKIDSVSNVNIHLKLNSDSVYSLTNGKYRNGVIVDIDGVYKDLLVQATGHTEKDSILISIYTEPSIRFPIVLEDISKISYFKRIRGNETSTFRRDSSEFNDKKYLFNSSFDITNEEDTTLAKINTISGYKYSIAYISDSIGVNTTPYYYYYISLPLVKFSNKLQIDFSVSDMKTIGNGLYDIKFGNKKNLQYNYIFPQPDIIGNGKIEYYTDEKKKEIIKNKGIIIQAVDIDALNEQNRKIFLYSVLVGTGLAFLLDIMIQLIRELRRLNRKEEKCNKKR